MPCYIDTSVLVALCTNEDETDRINKWYSNYNGELVSAIWCIPEFASALGIKQRTGQLNTIQAGKAWEDFRELCDRDINLLSLESAEYYTAANMPFDARKNLRAGAHYTWPALKNIV
jgi:uncharacterized protein